MSRPIGFAGGALTLKYHPYQIAALRALRARTADGKRLWRYIMLRAGRRGGKTRFGGLAVAEQAALPNSVIYVAAPTFNKLHEYVWPSVNAAIPAAWLLEGTDGWNENYQEMRLTNGTLIIGRSMDDIGWLRGPGPDLVWMDELCQTAKAGWDAAEPALADRKGVAIITTTPNGPDWVHKTFYERAEQGIPGYWAVSYKSTANPAFEQAEYDRLKATMDPEFFRQEIDAEIVDFKGAIYAGLLEKQLIADEAQHKKHFPEWPKIDPDRRAMVAMDPGADHPFAAILVIQGELGLVAVTEYRERNRPIRLHAAELLHFRNFKSLEVPRDILGWMCDPSQRQTMIELSGYGIPAMPSDNDVFGGIMRVKSWLHAEDLWISQTGCPRLVEELRGYRWAANVNENTGETKQERPVKEKDDLADCLRYLSLSWPGTPRPMGADRPNIVRREVPPEVEWTVARLRRIAELKQQHAEGRVNVSDHTMPADLSDVESGNPYTDFYQSTDF